MLSTCNVYIFVQHIHTWMYIIYFTHIIRYTYAYIYSSNKWVTLKFYIIWMYVCMFPLYSKETKLLVN